ncbi:hypothetical protein [Fusobacterium mortiferum]
MIRLFQIKAKEEYAIAVGKDDKTLVENIDKALKKISTQVLT